jgi:hypothetical protein
VFKPTLKKSTLKDRRGWKRWYFYILKVFQQNIAKIAGTINFPL